jgi:HD-GYP domain-containing protein (c-di-GMP phosphodiesterase class II)
VQIAKRPRKQRFELNCLAKLADTKRVNPTPGLSSMSPQESVRISEVLAAMSFALDLTEGQPMGHSLRTCLIAQAIAERFDFSIKQRTDLYYAALLKDVGCSSNAARVFELFGGDDRETKSARMRVDWASYVKALRFGLAHASPGASWLERARRIASLARLGPAVAGELVATRCTQGGAIVRSLGFGSGVVQAVESIEEHWDGRGQPRGLGGEEIPLLARVLCLAQSIDVFAMVDGPRSALSMADSRKGKWFDPSLVRATEDLGQSLEAWCALGERELGEAVRSGEPGDASLLAGPDALDRIALAFAGVVDAKSPYTAAHSYRVTEMSLAIARRLGFDEPTLRQLKRAALLHDIGKLSLSNSILDKPGPLSPAEWEAVRLHPYYTLRVLLHVHGFKEIAQVAASHHERLDGQGYFRALKGDQFPLLAQVLATADQWDALSTARPYRPALPDETALRILERDRDLSVSGVCIDALAEVVPGLAPGERVEKSAFARELEDELLREDAERRAA